MTVWPDWAIYWTCGNFSKPVATVNLSKSTTFLGNLCKGVKILNFSSEIILGNFYRHLVTFYWSHCLITKNTNLSIQISPSFWNQKLKIRTLKVFVGSTCPQRSSFEIFFLREPSFRGNASLATLDGGWGNPTSKASKAFHIGEGPGKEKAIWMFPNVSSIQCS